MSGAGIEGIAIYGPLTMKDVEAAIRKAYPKLNISIGQGPVSRETVSKLTKGDLLIADLAVVPSAEKLREQLVKKELELSKAEEVAAKSMLSIQTFHKQQQALFDEFVLLRQRYDEQKSSTVSILWTHCSRFHPDLRQIPPLEDKNFVETEEQVGDYSVGELLGEGQFATVKNCSMAGSDKEFALKIITKDRITSFTALMRVSNEIQNLRLLKNDFVVVVSKVLHTEQMLYIVTEKGGADLFDFFDAHPDGVPEDWAREIISCVLKGVMYCHDQGICHRDLKPENILLAFDSATGKCQDLKLCDFGLSTKFKSNTLLSDFCGSPGFFAPEMIIQGSYFGDKADVWSTGCILLELVAGHERFCEIWMTAYDYEILQDKDKFTRCIKETTADLPGNLTFSARLNDFILQFFELRPPRRPSVSALSTHDWLEGLAEVEFSVRPQRSVSMDVLRTSPHMSMLEGMTVTTGEEDMTQGLDRRYVEEIFSNLSERERKHMEEYIVAHKNDEGLHVMHLPPIVPATPNISGAKKLLRKGHEPNDFSTFYDGFNSPTSRGSISPVPSLSGSGRETGRASLLPGVVENEVLSDPDLGPKGSVGNRSLANLSRHPIDQAKLVNSQSDRNLDRC